MIYICSQSIYHCNPTIIIEMLTYQQIIENGIASIIQESGLIANGYCSCPNLFSNVTSLNLLRRPQYMLNLHASVGDILTHKVPCCNYRISFVKDL